MWNHAFIDGQNLHLWIKADWWKLNLNKFWIYLQNKYNVDKAYYYIWFYDSQHQQLYNDIQSSWFTLVFKKQTVQSLSKKKWNVDSDLIFEVMRQLLKESNTFDKVLLVSWDWDYKILVDFLIQENRFGKILIPNKKWPSTLLRKLPGKFWDCLINIKQKIEK